MQQMLVGLGGGPLIPDSVSYNVLGGGGSGGPPRSSSPSFGFNCGGGAGAHLVQGTFAPVEGTTYVMTIGAGGVRQNQAPSSSVSTFASAIGGAAPPSGAGGFNALYGQLWGGSRSGPGGAGAGGLGTVGSNSGVYVAGNGGPGVVLPLHPTSLRVGGGGGGGTSGGYPFGTATDGGGVVISYTVSQNGAVNRAAGGGGNSYLGGSGRLILRYSDSFAEPTATTGNPTVTVSGGYRHYDFTSSGSITF